MHTYVLCMVVGVCVCVVAGLQYVVIGCVVFYCIVLGRRCCIVVIICVVCCSVLCWYIYGCICYYSVL